MADCQVDVEAGGSIRCNKCVTDARLSDWRERVPKPGVAPGRKFVTSFKRRAQPGCSPLWQRHW